MSETYPGASRPRDPGSPTGVRDDMSVLVVVWLEGLGWLLGAKAWFPAFAGMADVAGSLNPVEACGMAPGSRETTTRALTQRIS